MYLCRLGTDEQARGPLPAQKTSLAIHVEFARQFLAFPCSTRCVRCAKIVPRCAWVSCAAGTWIPGGSVLPDQSEREQTLSSGKRFGFTLIYGPDTRTAPPLKRRQRSACEARNRGLSVPPASRRFDPAPGGSACGTQGQERRARRSTAAGGAGSSASQVPLLCSSDLSSGEHKKKAGTV